MYRGGTASPSLSREDLKFSLVEYLKSKEKIQWENIVQQGIEEPIGRGLRTQESQALLELIHEFTVANIRVLLSESAVLAA